MAGFLFLQGIKAPTVKPHANIDEQLSEPNQALMFPLRSEVFPKQPMIEADEKVAKKSAQTNQINPGYDWSEFRHQSVETQAGQMLMIGLVEQLPTEELKAFLKELRPGGIVLFRRNYKTVEELRRLIQFLHETSHEYSDTVPLIAIDEEGGMVTRLPWQNKLPSAYLLAQVNKPELTRSFGQEVGKILSHFGINVNFAPVLDLSQPHQFLRTRAYGDDQKTVERHGLAYASGLIEAGVVPVAKHFPGLSETKQDPHHDKTKHVYKNKSDFLEDVSAFFKFSRSYQASGVMLSHTIYPQFNAKKSAVMSPELISYLKKDLRFRGVVISDDLQMQGISYTAEENQTRMQTIIKKSFEAGCDMMMLSYSKKDQRQAHRKLIELLADPKNSQRAKEKITRILKIKSYVHQKKSQQRMIASQNEEQQQDRDQVLVANNRVSTAKLNALQEQLNQNLKSRRK